MPAVSVGTSSRRPGIFASSLRRAASALSGIGYEDGGLARFQIHHSISAKTYDLRYLITPEFETELECLVGDSDEAVAATRRRCGRDI